MEIWKLDESIAYRIYSYLIMSAITVYVGVVVVECCRQSDFDEFLNIFNFLIGHVLGKLDLILTLFSLRV